MKSSSLYGGVGRSRISLFSIEFCEQILMDVEILGQAYPKISIKPGTGTLDK